MKHIWSILIIIFVLLTSCIPEPAPVMPLEKRETTQDILAEAQQLEEQAREQARERIEEIRQEQTAAEQQPPASPQTPELIIQKVEPILPKSLGLYPYYFMEGTKFKQNFVTIVGEEAPSSYVVALGNLIARTPGDKPTGFSMLAGEIADLSHFNAIVVGNPCNNAVISRLYGNPFPCEDAPLPANKGLIRLIEAANGNVALLVTGKTDELVIAAVNMIGTPAFTSVSSSEICVQGTTFVAC